MWYDSPLVVSIVTVLLTLCVTQVSSWLDRWINRKHRRSSLRASFRAEVSQLRYTLGVATKFHSPQDIDLSVRPIILPREVYRANVAQIGDLDDNDLSEMLVQFYTSLDLLASDNRGDQPNCTNVFGRQGVLLIFRAYIRACLVELMLGNDGGELRAELQTQISEYAAAGLRLDPRTVACVERILGDECPELLADRWPAGNTSGAAHK